MRILVFGASGMIGHALCRILGEQHHVFGTMRDDLPRDSALARFLPAENWVTGVEVDDLDSIERSLSEVHPDAVINCIGIAKQAAEATDPVLSIRSNALFPHELAVICNAMGVRMIQLSTDCVFSGRKGMYTEQDTPDPVDLYGRSKLLGETESGEALTLRTSAVGRELRGHAGLFEWVLGNRGATVRGFDRAIYTGLTTAALARVIDQVLVSHPSLTGLWQVASEPITKYDLLCELNERLSLGLTIERDETFECDRSLDGSAFATETGVAVPSWDDMLTEFAADQPTYAFLGEDSV